MNMERMMATSAMAEVGCCQMIQGFSYSGRTAAAAELFCILDEGTINDFEEEQRTRGGRNKTELTAFNATSTQGRT
jgi:hypothetical protein